MRVVLRLAEPKARQQRASRDVDRLGRGKSMRCALAEPATSCGWDWASAPDSGAQGERS